MPPLWKTASHIFIAIQTVAAVAVPPAIATEGVSAVGNVALHIKAIPDQVNASETLGIEASFRPAQDIVSQHIKQSPDQVSLLSSIYDLKHAHVLADPRLKIAVLIAGGAVIGAIAAPAVIAALGFSTGGVIAGSAAAGIQAGIGNVAAGSAFAIMQSVGTVPLVSGVVGATVGAAAGGTAAVVNLKANSGPPVDGFNPEAVTEAATNGDSTEADKEALAAKE